jgi:tetratricopeptide (TPR) repeat protein
MQIRRLLQPLPCGLACLLLTAIYLIGPARNALGIGAASAVLLHIALGCALALPVALRVGRMLCSDRSAGIGLALLALLCALTGFWLFGRAALGHSVFRERLALRAHEFAGFAAFFWLASRFLAARRRSTASLRTNFGLASAAGMLLSLLILLVAPGALWFTTDSLTYRAEQYYRDLIATNPRQAENPLFPAGVRLSQGTTAEEAGLRWQEQSAAYCGRAGCHPTAYREWQQSAHRYAYADPIYQKVRKELIAKKGAETARWCAGCHSPQTALNPAVSAPAGVDCLSCHAATGTPTRAGNGRYTLTIPDTYPFGRETRGWKRALHEFLLRVRPAPHARAFRTPEQPGTSESCAACHRQSFHVPQNGYGFVRGPDPYGEWLNGPFSGRTARPPGLAAHPTRSCAECHFPRNAAGYTSHQSLGTSFVPGLMAGKTTFPEHKEDFLRRNLLTVDLFALRKSDRPNEPEAWLAPLDTPQEPIALQPGDSVTLDVVVTNRNIGHSFPIGYSDIQDAWLEVSLRDATGKMLLSNGLLRSEQEMLPPKAHVYRQIPLDRNGKELRYHENTEQVATVLRRSIPPGGSDLARYRFTVPKASPEGRPLALPLQLRARLRFRALRPDFARWALGSKADSAPLSAIDLAESKTTLPIGKVLLTKRPTASAYLRFVEYGVALLAPPEVPDLNRAIRAFRTAQKLAPDRPEPYLGLGRAYLREPALLAARAQFEVVLRLAPNHPEARAGLGVVYAKQGQFDRAIALLQELAAQFPQDSALLRDLGMAYYQQGSYREAAGVLERALAADPEDARAHFQLQQCYKSLQRLPEARREETIRRYLGDDRLRARLVPEFLRANPQVPNPNLPFPEYPLR